LTRTTSPIVVNLYLPSFFFPGLEMYVMSGVGITTPSWFLPLCVMTSFSFPTSTGWNVFSLLSLDRRVFFPLPSFVLRRLVDSFAGGYFATTSLFSGHIHCFASLHSSECPPFFLLDLNPFIAGSPSPGFKIKFPKYRSCIFPNR